MSETSTKQNAIYWTPAKKNLMKCFKILKMEKETILGIMCFLDNKTKVMAMEDFLLTQYKNGNKRPTEQEILQELRRILGV